MNIRISPVTPMAHIMHTDKFAGQEPFAAGSRIATHSMWWVIGNKSRHPAHGSSVEADARCNPVTVVGSNMG